MSRKHIRPEAAMRTNFIIISIPFKSVSLWYFLSCER